MNQSTVHICNVSTVHIKLSKTRQIGSIQGNCVAFQIIITHYCFL